jgi:hypothetical protein
MLMILGVLVEGLVVRLPGAAGAVQAHGERIGVIHIHTRASDGSGTLPQIYSFARRAGLSFIGITDHNVAMTPAQAAAVPSDLAVIGGEELSTSSGHFLALGIPPGWSRPKTPQAEKLLEAAHAIGAFTVIAHPFNRRIPWRDWRTSNFEGLEIWNDDSMWRRNNPFNLLIALLLYSVNDHLAMVRLARTPRRNLAKWDALLAQKPTVGMCGADAHAAVRIGHRIVLRFPGYVPVFELAREHVLLDPAGTDADSQRAGAAEILDALRRGRSFCALDALYPADGFQDRISSGDSSGGPGEHLIWASGARIHISVPAGASQPKIIVIRNGRELIIRRAWTMDATIPGPGYYRTEVFLRQPGLTGWRRWTMWLFTNPIYVKASPSAGAIPRHSAGSLAGRRVGDGFPGGAKKRLVKFRL